jgi:large subunit ribosomal protein L6
LPKGVKLTVGDELLVEGPRQPDGSDSERDHADQENGNLELKRDGEDKAALHGLTRALAANAVQGIHRFHAGVGHRRHRLP